MLYICIHVCVCVCVCHDRIQYTIDTHCGHKECFGTAYTVSGSPVANDIKRRTTADGGTNERFDSVRPPVYRNGR